MDQAFRQRQSFNANVAIMRERDQRSSESISARRMCASPQLMAGHIRRHKSLHLADRRWFIPTKDERDRKSASSRGGSCVRDFHKRLARDGILDNYFRALAMAADGAGQTVRLTDRQVSRLERRNHALIHHPDGPAVLLFDNVKCDHGILRGMGCKEFHTLLPARNCR